MRLLVLCSLRTLLCVGERDREGGIREGEERDRRRGTGGEGRGRKRERQHGKEKLVTELSLDLCFLDSESLPYKNSQLMA